jgi:hypothetical protein
MLNLCAVTLGRALPIEKGAPKRIGRALGGFSQSFRTLPIRMGGARD